MDRQDRLRALLRGTSCTVCGDPLGAERIRILAEREELAFVELPCPACGATTLGMVTLRPDGDAFLDVSGYGEFGPADEARFGGARPLAADDVLDMHTFLAGYRGSLSELLEDRRPDGPGDPGRPGTAHGPGSAR
jgi:hypothetical protein